jgi:hypothetical protein
MLEMEVSCKETLSKRNCAASHGMRISKAERGSPTTHDYTEA